MAKTFYCTDWFGADTILQGGRDKDERKVGNNRRLIRCDEDTILLRFHNTDVVTYHRDGTCTLYMGGWDTVTTKRTLNDYSPARVFSAYGRKDFDGVEIGTAIYHSGTDRVSPEKIQKCRKCHGVGIITEICRGDGYWYDWRHQDQRKQILRALPGMTYVRESTGYSWEPCHVCGVGAYEDCEPEPEHKRIDRRVEMREYRARFSPRCCHHGFLESHLHRYQCVRCDGVGIRDYGSHTIPYRLDPHSRIRVDDKGMPLGVESDVRELLAYRAKLEEFFEYRSQLVAKLEGSGPVKI